MPSPVFSNHRLLKINSFLSGQNTTCNVSDLDLEQLQILINQLKRNTSWMEESEDCGCMFQDIAESYAKHYHPYFAIVVCVFGSIANIFNILVLTRKDLVCAPINRILTALAVADILLMLEYVPYAYYYYMALPQSLDFPYHGAIYMLFHAHITQVLHTTSICLTLTLAVWRYLALRYPQRKHIICSEFRCTLGISISYLLPFVLCIPTYTTIGITTQEIVENRTKYTLYHTDLSDTFKSDKTLFKINFWVYGVIIKLLPCCILTVMTFWLIRTVFSAKKGKRLLRGYECYDLHEIGTKRARASKMERRADHTTKMLVAVLLLFLMTEFPQGIFALMIGIKGTYLFVDCYQLYGEVMDILALINGSINFILYCSMNRMFRSTFGLLVRRGVGMWTPAATHAKPRVDTCRSTDENERQIPEILP